MRSILAIALSAAAVFAGEAVYAAADLAPAASAQPANASSEVVATDGSTSRLTAADAQAWLDGFMSYALPRGDIAGAVVAIVKDGQVLLKKGYGYADIKTHKPVDPDLTLFRPGSVSKLFTWTAVMQLVGEGKLDLDGDVNQYIDFKIPERDGKPITLRNIMTHTAGFEEQAKGIMSTEDDAIPALDQHLKRWTPNRIFAPGSTPAYSNYATALAGYIVARTSGMSFDDYLDAKIFAPLDMKHSSFRQPLPERLKPLMSKGYPQASLPEKPYEIVGPAPAGSLASSGADMANFMIAHLQNGRFGDGQILKPQTAQEMHGTALTMLPRVNRMLLGFYETNYDGHRVIGHGGDTQWFHSYLHLFIDDGVGLYMSFNSGGKEGAAGGIRSQLFEQFADRYFPGDTLDGKVDAATAKQHARMMAGLYDNSRRMDSSFFSLLNLFGAVKVVANEDDTIGISMVTNLAGMPMKWREVEPFVWRQTEGKQLLSAKVQDGHVVRFSFDDVSPFMMFEPVPALKSSAWLMPVFVAALVALLLTALAWPIAALTRRHYRAKYALAGVDAKAHRWVRISALVTVVLWVVWTITVVSSLENLSMLTPASDWIFWVLQVLSLIVFLAATAYGIWNAIVVVRSRRSWYAKLWAVVIALAFIILLWIALAFHVIAFDVNY